MTGQSPERTRLLIRVVLTVIFSVATIVAFVAGRPVPGVILACFVVVSAALLVRLRTGRSPNL
jgi:hypothetical protein